MVSEKLEGYIQRFYDSGRNTERQHPMNLFSPGDMAEGLPMLHIDLASLGISPTTHYDTISEAVKQIQQITVRKESYDRNGKFQGVYYFPLFNKFYVPNSQSQGEDVGEHRIVQRKQGYIEAQINPEIVAYAFDMSEGYFKHLRLIAQYACKKATPRIYFYLMRNRRGNNTVRASYDDLKAYCGYLRRDKDSDRVVDLLPKYSMFRRRVIENAQHDLERMAAVGHSEITFTFTEVYRRGQRRGNPEYIDFTIHDSALGKQIKRIGSKTAGKAGREGRGVVQTTTVSGDIHAHEVGDSITAAARDRWREILRRFAPEADAPVLQLRLSAADKDVLTLTGPRQVVEQVKQDGSFQRLRQIANELAGVNDPRVNTLFIR